MTSVYRSKSLGFRLPPEPPLKILGDMLTHRAEAQLGGLMPSMPAFASGGGIYAGLSLEQARRLRDQLAAEGQPFDELNEADWAEPPMPRIEQPMVSMDAGAGSSQAAQDFVQRGNDQLLAEYQDYAVNPPISYSPNIDARNEAELQNLSALNPASSPPPLLDQLRAQRGDSTGYGEALGKLTDTAGGLVTGVPAFVGDLAKGYLESQRSGIKREEDIARETGLSGEALTREVERQARSTEIPKETMAWIIANVNPTEGFGTGLKPLSGKDLAQNTKPRIVKPLGAAGDVPSASSLAGDAPSLAKAAPGGNTALSRLTPAQRAEMERLAQGIGGLGPEDMALKRAADEAKSGFYRDTGHVTKRANELSSRMDRLKPPSAGIVEQAGGAGPLPTAASIGVQGTAQGVMSELDSDPNTNFGSGFVGGVVGGAGRRLLPGAASPTVQNMARTAAKAADDGPAWPELRAAVAAEQRAAITDYGTAAQRDLWMKQAGQSRAGLPPAFDAPPPAGPLPPSPLAQGLGRDRMQFPEGYGAQQPAFGGMPAPAATKPAYKFNLVNEIKGLLGVPQTVMANLDASFTGRQGMVLGWSNPREWAKSANAGFKAFTSEAAAKSADDMVKADPWHTISQGARKGLGFADETRGVKGHIYTMGTAVEGAERVPGFTGLTSGSKVSEVLGNTPGFKNSQRGAVATMNVQGQSVYSKYMDNLWDSGLRGEALERQAAALKDVINHARGYGASWGQLADNINLLFSSRYTSSRFQVLLDPFIQPGSLLKPSARQLAAKNLAAMISGNMAVLGFLGVSGAAAGDKWTVDFDPRSGDWGKVRVGNTTIDPWAGFGPIVRLAARSAMGESTGREGTVSETDLLTETTRFFRNKQSPVVSKLTELLTGEDGMGKKAKFTPESLAEMFVPLIVAGAYEAFTGTQGNIFEKTGAAALSTGASFVGLGAQTYETSAEIRKRLLQDDIKAGVVSQKTYLDPEGNEKPVTQPWQLEPLEREAYNQRNKAELDKLVEGYPDDAFSAIRGVQDEFAAFHAENDALLATDPFEWRDQRGALKTAERERIEGIRTGAPEEFPDREPRTRLDALNADYREQMEQATDKRGKVDWELVDRWTASLSPKDQDLLFQQRLAGETPTSKSYLKAVKLLEPYFDARDEGWTKIASTSPSLAQFGSFEQWRSDRIAFLRTNYNMSYTQAKAEFDKMASPIETAMGQMGTAYLAQHQHLVPLLDRYGFYVPSMLRGLTAPVGVR